MHALLNWSALWSFKVWYPGKIIACAKCISLVQKGHVYFYIYRIKQQLMSSLNV